MSKLRKHLPQFNNAGAALEKNSANRGNATKYREVLQKSSSWGCGAITYGVLDSRNQNHAITS